MDHDPQQSVHRVEHPQTEEPHSAPTGEAGPSAYATFERYSPEWFFIGPQGLRAGVSVLLAYLLYRFLRNAIGSAFFMVHLGPHKGPLSPEGFLLVELIPFLAVLASGSIMALVEHRNFLDYNLTGPRRVQHFLSGSAAGFVALSALIGLLSTGGWLRFGVVALSGAAIFHYAFVWGCMFLVVGCVEEGMFRCYLQFTLARGINFWWALAAVAAMCLYLMRNIHGIGVWGVYIAAMLGFFPCLYLHQKSASRSGFWQAAWVTSTAFGFFHTSNNGENWIGIFAAAAIGFIFCVSIRVTGSAWWAIGCHAAWDWGETYFYGAADSGITAPGHYLTSLPVGNIFWSGGADGPEGSVLILAALALLLLWLLLVDRRRAPSTPAVAAPSGISV